jgi:hypothetical protein
MTAMRGDPGATSLPDGRVLIAGGLDGSDVLAIAEIFDPGAGKFAATGSMATAREGFSATLLQNGKVLVAGGVTSFSTGQATASAELFDPASGRFSPTGSMTSPRLLLSATRLADGRVLAAGGRSGLAGTSLASTELYDSSSGTFNPSGPMTTAREYQTATLLPSGAVLFAGGKSQGTSAASYVGQMTSAEVCG